MKVTEEALKDLSIEQLESVVKQATDLQKERTKEKIESTMAEINRLADSIGMVARFSPKPSRGPRGANSTKGVKVPVKYRDPHNSMLTWSGRGVKPKWLQSRIDNGFALEAFLVQ